MGFSWDLANEQAETLKDEITVSAPEALQLVSKILRIPSCRITIHVLHIENMKSEISL